MAPWAEAGVPAFYYLNRDMVDHYFIFHHSQGDTMTVYTKEDLDYAAAIYAALAYSVANI